MGYFIKKTKSISDIGKTIVKKDVKKDDILDINNNPVEEVLTIPPKKSLLNKVRATSDPLTNEKPINNRVKIVKIKTDPIRNIIKPIYVDVDPIVDPIKEKLKKKQYGMNGCVYSKTIGSNGRLGNQLFQFAAIYGYSRENNKDYSVENWICVRSGKDFKSYFEGPFSKTPINPEIVEINYVETDFDYNEIPYIKENINIWGYFQSEYYFKKYADEIIDILQPRIDLLLELKIKYSDIDFKKTASLHIRRGDYLILRDYYNQLTIDNYYSKAIEHLTNNGVENILIFSDDIKWCKENFKSDNFYFSEENSEIEDLFLMSFCAHNVIANSSFSWWGAYLNKNKGKIVIAPKKWWGTTNNMNENTIIPESWVRL
jgi:hypothetical protein